MLYSILFYYCFTVTSTMPMTITVVTKGRKSAVIVVGKHIVKTIYLLENLYPTRGNPGLFYYSK